MGILKKLNKMINSTPSVLSGSLNRPVVSSGFFELKEDKKVNGKKNDPRLQKGRGK